jgi:hypothetical protein
MPTIPPTSSSQSLIQEDISPVPKTSSAYDGKYAEWYEDNKKRLDEHATEYDKKKSRYYFEKLRSMIRARRTPNPPVTSFATGKGEEGDWELESVERFVSLLYKQRSDWLNPAKKDKIHLARAVYEVQQKNPEAGSETVFKCVSKIMAASEKTVGQRTGKFKAMLDKRTRGVG